MEFPLSRAPKMFFDPQLWNIFVSYFESNEIAYERIGYPPDLTGYHREYYGMRFNLSKERWQEIEEARAVGRELLRGLHSKFLSEDLTATGIPRGFARPTREAIPPSEWLELWPNFAGNWAMSTTGSYDNVLLSWNPPDEKAEMLELCELFLTKRKSEGETKKTVLIEKAATYFGKRVPDRIFNSAYQKVFQRKRGRPPRVK